MEGPRNEAELLRGIAAGDRGAAEALVESTYRQIYAAVFRLCGGDAELAADLTQETYRKAWQALSRFRGKARFSTWLYRIAYNTFLNHLRRPRPVADPKAEEVETLPGDEPDPVGEMARGEDAELLRRAVLSLPDDLRFTVTARFWQGLTVREIAEEVGVTPVAIRKRLRRAFRALRAQIEEVN